MSKKKQSALDFMEKLQNKGYMVFVSGERVKTSPLIHPSLAPEFNQHAEEIKKILLKDGE